MLYESNVFIAMTIAWFLGFITLGDSPKHDEK